MSRIEWISWLWLCLCSTFAAADVLDSRSINETVDYVIVGGGPAGFVLAERLSRDPHTTVVLLQAGPDGDDNPLIYTPAFAPLLAGSPPTNNVWNYYSQPDATLGGLAPALAQGRALGGGSAVNYMGYCRGAASVFDEWAELSGNEELRWDSLYQSFKATSRYKAVPLDYTPSIDANAYGDGPLEVTAGNDNFGLNMQFVDAVKDILGVPEIDANDGNGIGVTTGSVAIRASNHTRGYALNTYGYLMAGRPNAKIIPRAWATKIVVESGTAKSVNYVHDSSTLREILGKEIIVSAGAIGSPKLLMLSGIGPKQDLEELGIPVVADIPEIGKNLYDHHFSVLEYEVTQKVTTVWQWSENATYAAIAEALYKQNSSGPLGMTDAVGWAAIRVPDATFEGLDDQWPTSLPPDRGQILLQASNAAFLPNSPNTSIISPYAALVQPQAAGHIRLSSSDYRDDPLIFSNYYGSPADKAMILYGYKKLREVMRSPRLAPLIVKEVFPGANVTSDEDLWHAIQSSAQTFHHPLGTLALGKVLDGQTWRIKGLSGIRVVDSSTFPSPPTCHIQASVYALADYVAGAIIKQDREV